MDNGLDPDEDLLTYDECEAIGLDGTGINGDERFPYTYGSLTDAEWVVLEAYWAATSGGD
jgi:hypothetical protein